MAQLTRAPTSDIATGGTIARSSGTTNYTLVNDYPDTADPLTSYVTLGTTANSFFVCGFSNFDVPAGSTINWVEVQYYDEEPASGTNASAGRIRVNSTYYNSATHNPTTTTAQRLKRWTTNPAGGSWTVDQVNNVGGTGLNAFGVIGTDSNPVFRVGAMQLVVDYTPPPIESDQSGRLTLRGVQDSTKIEDTDRSVADVSGIGPSNRPTAPGFDAGRAGAVSTDVAGRLLPRATQDYARTSTAAIAGQVTLRGSQTSAKTAETAVSARLLLRGVSTYSTSGVGTTDVAGRLALLGTAAAAKTGDADAAGRVGLRGTVETAKTGAADVAGRLWPRGASDGAPEGANARVDADVSGIGPVGVPFASGFNAGRTSAITTAVAGRLSLRAVSDASKIGLGEQSGRLALAGAALFDKIGIGEQSGRFSVRGSLAYARTSSADASGRIRLIGASAFGALGSGSTDVAGALRLLGSSTGGKFVTADQTGQIGLRGAATASKTGTGDQAGRIALRGSEAAAKTVAAAIEGRLLLRGASAYGATTLAETDVAGRLILRGLVTAEKIADAALSGRLALIGADVSTKTGATDAAGRLALRAELDALKIADAAVAGRVALRGQSTGSNAAIPEYDYRGMVRLLGSTTATKLGDWSAAGVAFRAPEASQRPVQTNDRRPGQTNGRRPKQF